jgi:S1-C subfamily serine protease
MALKAWREKLDEDFTFTGTSSPLSNFLWITRFNPPEKRRPSIGVVLRQRADQEGLWIERVIPNSPGEKAGLLLGDRLMTVEGREITKVKDIHDAVVQKGWEKDIHMTILREGVEKEITVTLSPPKE